MAQSQSTAKRAELAAASLFAIRQTRSDLITGQAEQTPPDGKSLQLMLDNLEAQEQALMAMFIGTTSTRTDVSSFSLVPDDNITDMVIARISPLDGIVDAEDLSGEPVYLNLKVTQRGEMPENEKGVRLTFPKNGLAYCIPGHRRHSLPGTSPAVTQQNVYHNVCFDLTSLTINRVILNHFKCIRIKFKRQQHETYR